MVVVGTGGESKHFMEEKKKDILLVLPNIYYHVSDHYFAALVTLGLLTDVSSEKVGGLKAIRNSRPGLARILNRI